MHHHVHALDVFVQDSGSHLTKCLWTVADAPWAEMGVGGGAGGVYFLFFKRPFAYLVSLLVLCQFWFVIRIFEAAAPNFEGHGFRKMFDTRCLFPFTNDTPAI